MSATTNELDLKAIASQLSKPEGEMGLTIGEKMNVWNIAMTNNTIKSLSLKEADSVLELGHGNGKHIPSLLNCAKNIQYTGLEISNLMYEEAAKNNIANKAHFKLYDGSSIPFDENTFDKIMTVNTLYFWQNALDTANQIYKVLKKGGTFSLCFTQAAFMKVLPFTQYGFELYDTQKVNALFEQTKFKNVKTIDIIDQVEIEEGTLRDRHFTIILFEK